MFLHGHHMLRSLIDESRLRQLVRLLVEMFVVVIENESVHVDLRDAQADAASGQIVWKTIRAVEYKSDTPVRLLLDTLQSVRDRQLLASYN